ncbi:gustatory receptor [Tribolium castaneum]|uniref:Gustatory receptor n=1 Tax=Tribolium castaneum TaxID=7070 RepID=A2AX70_TRICA|nr:gustatory receptor [Tribolium castaneum]XP_008192055.1 PREDICTED: gustatory receptor isoform X1 [Tribolium castaneum]ABY40585.1 gustatory receptor [Tribolium castaneum]EFA02937.1 gustatory receptor 104 [Tribolium castaneum]CAL23141.2 gustatory receptor candidate 8 [Tribolium castaneum]CAL23178.2 gustatory receptor candidate 45 [Tribolium castaneum]|eukprot:XP_008192055.1 PREDICTED: gustatory receptor isoform X1 [Tribolium castaneum]
MCYFNYSKKDIRSLSFFYKICNIFGIVPPYSFEKPDSQKSLWKKIQGVVLVSIIAAGTAYSIYVRHTYYRRLYTITHLVLDYLDEFLIVALAFQVILNSCFCDPAKWIRLNNNLQYIDEVLKNRDSHETNLLRNVSVQFFVYVILYILATVFLAYVWICEMGVVTLQAYTLHLFCVLYVVLLHFLTYNLSLGIKLRYDDVNNLFRIEESEEKNIIVSLRQIGSLSQLLSETVALFNDVFGTCLILITGKSIVQLLTCLNFITNNLKSENEEFKEKLLAANLCLVIYTLVSVSLVMVTCDACTIASKQTISWCYKLQEQFVTNSEVRTELFKLAQHVSANIVHITAGNYFEINKATLCGIFGTTTTYFIVILQFNQSSAK